MLLQSPLQIQFCQYAGSSFTYGDTVTAWVPPHITAGCCSEAPFAGQVGHTNAEGTMVKPLSHPKIVKKRTKPFKRHQCDRKITVKVHHWSPRDTAGTPSGDHRLHSKNICRSHGGVPRVLTPESEESSRAVVLLCQTLVMAQTKRQGTCFPTVCAVRKAP